jgi:hypothetical protein
MKNENIKNELNHEIKEIKVSFISILRTISFLKNNIMSDLLKKYRFKIDHEENVIQIFDLKSFQANLLLSRKAEKSFQAYSPVYEIEVSQSARLQKYYFTLVDFNHYYDNSTGFYNEKYFTTVRSILSVFQQMIEEELQNYLERCAEVDYHRKDRTESPQFAALRKRNADRDAKK